MPLAEKVKNLSAICKVCGANAAFTFKHDASLQRSPGQNIEIGGADMYMPLCRECFNEKTRQQQVSKALDNSALAGSHNNSVALAFGSSTTLAESNQNQSSSSVRIEGSNSIDTPVRADDDPMSSSSTQKNNSTSSKVVPLFDMKQARSALEGDSDMKADGSQTKELTHKFSDENSTNG